MSTHKAHQPHPGLHSLKLTPWPFCSSLWQICRKTVNRTWRCLSFPLLPQSNAVRNSATSTALLGTHGRKKDAPMAQICHGAGWLTIEVRHKLYHTPSLADHGPEVCIYQSWLEAEENNLVQTQRWQLNNLVISVAYFALEEARLWKIAFTLRITRI